MRRILFLARAEVLHIVRDRTTLAQVLVIPIVQLLILVNAATFVIRNTPMAVVDHDHRGGADHRAGLGERVEVERHLLGKRSRHRAAVRRHMPHLAPGEPGLQHEAEDHGGGEQGGQRERRHGPQV